MEVIHPSWLWFSVRNYAIRGNYNCVYGAAGLCVLFSCGREPQLHVVNVVKEELNLPAPLPTKALINI